MKVTPVLFIAIVSVLVSTASAQERKKSAKAPFKGARAGEEMKDALGMKFCWIPPGKFEMGDVEMRDEKVQVELTRGFWMGKYEVTQGEYKKITGTNPSWMKMVGERAPVEQVSWKEAINFCAQLTLREQEMGRLPAGWKYTLPTDAQWEFACRAGTTGDFNVSGSSLDELGWFKGNSGKRTHEVGKKKPNGWGLHDMHGNVREWCAGWYVRDEKISGGKDPRGPEKGEQRMLRGGAWDYDPWPCRSAYRSGAVPDYRDVYLGIRLAIVPIAND